MISLPTTIQFAVIAKLRRLVSESTTIQFNIFGWDSVADGHACHVLLTGLVADAGKLRRLSCSQDDFIYFLPVAATSLRIYMVFRYIFSKTKDLKLGSHQGIKLGDIDIE